MEENILSPQGRIRRSAFWTRWLIVFFCNIVLSIMSEASGGDTTVSFLVVLISLMLATFMLLQTIKRMHDVNKSGWYSIVPLYNLILALTDGTPGMNKYGRDPKNRPTQCPSCQTINEPENYTCKNCGISFTSSYETSSARETATSDTNILVFIIVGIVGSLIRFVLNKMIVPWHELPMKYIHFTLNLVWVGTIIYLTLGLKKENNRILGLVLGSIWAVYILAENVMWVFFDRPL